MNFIYMDDRLGFCEVDSDTAWVMDCYGELVRVPFAMPQWYWQEI